jgi:WD40 repeat protein
MDPSETLRGRRRALLIANGRYQDPQLRRLRSPTGDVEALRDVLGDPMIGDFEVSSVVDHETQATRQAIEGFFAGGALRDLLLLYISGHGLLASDGSLYFATPSTRLDLLLSTAVDSSFVARTMHDCRARSIVLILDCCHSGAFGQGYEPKGPRSVDIEHRFDPNARGRVVLTASSRLEYAFEDQNLDSFEVSEPGSVFTRFLVHGLRTGEADLDGDGEVSVKELYEYVYQRVRESRSPQTPGMSGNAYGTLVIASSARQPVLPLGLRQALVNPIPGVRAAAVAALEPLLTGDDPALAQAARDALARTPSDPAVRVAVQDVRDATGIGSELQRLRHDGDVRAVAFGAGATLLATASDDATARVWDLAAGGAELRRVSHTNRGRPARQLLAVAFNPEATAIATAGRDRTARVWDLADGRQVLRVSHRHWVRAVAFSPDGEQLATAGEDGTARVWSVSNGRELLSIEDGKPLNDVAFSPDGALLATAGDDGSARVWDLSADRQLLRAAHDGTVWAVAFSPDGRRIATASDDGTARIWDVPDGAEIRRVAHAGAVWAVAFDATGSRLATAGDDVAAHVWDLTDGRELRRVSHDGVVWAVAFSPGADRLATASADHSARVWAV